MSSSLLSSICFLIFKPNQMITWKKIVAWSKTLIAFQEPCVVLRRKMVITRGLLNFAQNNDAAYEANLENFVFETWMYCDFN